MCLSRLKAGEPPACARACPTGAIRITLVNTGEVKKNYEEFVDVPDAPASNYTYPTTRYKTSRSWPANMVSVDYLNVKPEHAHWPLVFMLILTQLSVGTFLVELILKRICPPELNLLLFPIHTGMALGAGLLALAVSVFHLGRPLYAFRAVLGLKTSWLSREILAFGIFAFLAVLYVLCVQRERISQMLGHFLGGPEALNVLANIVFLSGLIGVLCSVMVYRDTKRPFWDNNMTTMKFLMTMILLGLAMSSAISLGYTMLKAPGLIFLMMKTSGRIFCRLMIGLSLVKMVLELSIFYFLKKDDRHFLRKTAVLMTMPLKKFTFWRFASGIAGGVVLPLFVLSVDAGDRSVGIKLAGGALLSFMFLAAGEFLERYLFFRAVVPLKMPGGKIN